MGPLAPIIVEAGKQALIATAANAATNTLTDQLDIDPQSAAGQALTGTGKQKIKDYMTQQTDSMTQNLQQLEAKRKRDELAKSALIGAIPPTGMPNGGFM